jgi:hypothetical protein
MVFIFCYKTDFEAIWLYNELRAEPDIDVKILFAEDLYEARNWNLRINNDGAGASVMLPGGNIINTKNVTLFLNRVQFINHPFWKKLDGAEKDYFVQEWNAFLLAWLKAFEPVLLNKPVPNGLAGFNATTLKWKILAAQTGFTINEEKFSSSTTTVASLYTPETGKSTKSVLVFNDTVFAAIELAGLSKAAMQLAATTHCKLLEISVEKNNRNAYCFVSANPFASLSKYGINFLNAFINTSMTKQNKFSNLLKQKALYPLT